MQPESHTFWGQPRGCERHAIVIAVAAAGLSLLLAGCSAEIDKPADASDAESLKAPYAAVVEASARASGVTQDLTPAEANAVARARLTLAQNLEVTDVDAALLVSVTAQRWNNGSLGCARPGEMSAQVMLDGHKVVLEHEALSYQIHLGPGNARVCE